MSDPAKNSTGGGPPAGATGGNSTGGAPGGGPPGGGHGSSGPTDADILNILLSSYLYETLAVISAILIIYRVAVAVNKHVRHVTCLYNDTQHYFATPSSKMSWLKKNVIYAPIFGKRHNREFQLSSAVNVGTLPTRLQLVFLLGYFVTNIIFCVKDINFSGPFTAAAGMLRSRTGVLSVVNMIPLFLMAGRNNPLILILGISFDTYNLIHRWIGRIVILEALTHSIAHLMVMGNGKTIGFAFQRTFGSPSLMWGFVVSISSETCSVDCTNNGFAGHRCFPSHWCPGYEHPATCLL
jgi:hypothetical protein